MIRCDRSAKGFPGSMKYVSVGRVFDPVLDALRHELRAVVALDDPRMPAALDELVENSNHIVRVQERAHSIQIASRVNSSITVRNRSLRPSTV